MKTSIISLLLVLSIHISYGQACQKWVFGYVPTYTQGVGGIPFLSPTEYSKLTHIGHLGPYVRQDGSLDMGSNGATNYRLSSGVSDAHNNGVPILMSFQAWYTDYLPALADNVARAALIDNVLSLLDAYNYDGIDVDLEPIMSPWVAGIQSGNPDYVSFINTLYDSLQTRICSFTNQKPLLAVAANGYAGPVMNLLQNKFDMINLLTYDLAGVFPGWVSWHDSPVFSGGNIMPSTGQPMPSVHGEVIQCIDAGVSPSKLGVGISMDAFRWQGGTGTTTGGVVRPMQAYTTDPTWTRMSYKEFIQNHYSPVYYEYDYNAKMSYLSKDYVGSAQDEFWSYNDLYSCIDKVDYVWDNFLGGSMIWELNSGYIYSNQSGDRIPQLNFIYNQNCARAGALAVELINDVECITREDGNVLSWKTTSEVGLDYFVIYGAINAAQWKALDTVKTYGYGSLYKYIDKYNLFNEFYYKIKVVDFEGNSVFSPIVTSKRVNFNKTIIFPNPVSNILNIDYSDLQEVYLYNESGVLISNFGKIEYLDMSEYESGLYFLKLISLTETKTIQVIRSRD